ncbi:uncharacterized protein LOC112044616 [Bicyclus anynana]|uniref:Uncharacterized protein LOC112044616 n=1 Tax=Bicyclus anynana TaxID=110368 RepID=A0A6J1MTL0_BICAN|nr:uncharacterized protein LOC112044616 [Bicyclus anynana]
MDNGKLETVPPGTVHLDTVRTLHQTVVSLRTALEISKNELKELKEKYQEHSRCIEYTDIIEKLSLENHILRRKIIDSGVDRYPHQDINFEVSYTPKTIYTDEYCDSEVVIKTASTEKETASDDVPSHLEEPSKTAERLEEILEESKSESIVSENLNFPNATSSPVQEFDEPEPISELSIPKDPDVNIHNFKTKLELLSKFDVKIKVRTLKEGSIISSTTSESDTTLEEKKDIFLEKSGESKASFQFEEHREHFENIKNSKGDTINIKTASSDNIKMAVPNEAEVKSKADKFDVQVRITSEENLVVKETSEGTHRKDTINLDVDNLSLRSLSDGDNSVFSEGGTTPLEHNAASDEKHEQENASGNESEEVDDIELIFTTDESKDMSNLQEDLVSIRETDQWAPASASTTHSTPVLIKFHTLDPDFQSGGQFVESKKEDQENTPKISESSLKIKRVSLPNDKDIRHVGFTEKGSLDLPSRGILKSCDNRSDNMLYRRSPNTSTRRLDSVDSLTGEYNYRGLSFDNTKSSSFELGSSLDVLHREESVDSFHKTRMGHRFSVFAETDISKCGISEDDLASNLNVRRNTCPNPFAYRPLSRGVPRTTSKSTCRPRPVIYQGYGPRRESAAQTDVSALPPRWTSDGYLAYKVASTTPSVVPTLPQRTAVTRRLTVPDARPAPLQRRTDEARRVLLSDIGFTSMVPELSRSAEPLWTIRRTTPAPLPETPRSPLSRYRYRSPCLSVDRSNDWMQQTNAPSRKGMPWRGSLPDVRRDDTDELLQETEAFLRRSIDNLQTSEFQEGSSDRTGHPYIPAEARQLRLGHAVKIITPQGRLAVGRVRYVGLAGGTAAKSGVVIGAEFSISQYPGIPRNDGTYQGRRYFLTPQQHTALFVPFSKVVMAWAN